ncbi:MAG: TraB/GumN family protein [Spirochaetaceae bacterium]
MSNEVIVIKEGDTITRVNIGDREICLIGTAHVSAESVAEVERVISEEKPDHVCVEIDATRYKSMTQHQSWKDMNIVKIIKEQKSFVVLANLMLSSFQKRMGSSVGMKPGEDMKAAIDVAEKEGIPFSFSDRDIQVTLNRAWRKSSFWDKNKVLAVLISSAFSGEEASAEDIENLKDRNELEGMMDELAKELPKVKEVLIDERDQYLAVSAFDRPEKKVVSVVGAGHVPGMIRWFEDLESKKKTNDVSEISHVPPKSKLSKALPFILPIIIIALITAGFIFNGADVGFEMIRQWVLTNGVLSALGSIIALGHPLTILAAFVSAPITSLNPMIGVGIVTGIVETALRKPRVEDFETLTEDVSSIKTWYKNRVLRILLVVALSSFGSVAGTWIGGAFIAAVFGG